VGTQLPPSISDTPFFFAFPTMLATLDLFSVPPRIQNFRHLTHEPTFPPPKTKPKACFPSLWPEQRAFLSTPTLVVWTRSWNRIHDSPFLMVCIGWNLFSPMEIPFSTLLKSRFLLLLANRQVPSFVFSPVPSFRGLFKLTSFRPPKDLPSAFSTPLFREH